MRDVYRSDGLLKSFDELNRQFSIPFSRTVLQGLIRAVRRTYGSEIEKFNILEPGRPRAVECLFFPMRKLVQFTVYCCNTTTLVRQKILMLS